MNRNPGEPASRDGSGRLSPSHRRPLARPRLDRVRAREGAALVEFVVLLPLLLVLLGGIYFLYQSCRAKQTAMREARSCGWRFALEGCESPPDGCQIDTNDQGDRGVEQAHAALHDGSWIDAAILLPVLGSAVRALFGVGTRAQVSGSVQRPRVLGGGEVRLAGGFYVLCNTRARTLGEMATETFCKLIPGDIAGRLGPCYDYVQSVDQLDALRNALPPSE